VTYVLGVRFRSSLLLVADSAATTFMPTESAGRELSSFGERHVSTGGRIVHEAALKLINVRDKVLLTCAGEPETLFRAAQDLARTLDSSAVDSSVRRSVERAAENGPGACCLICAYWSMGMPVLASFNREGNGSYERHDECVDAGSLQDPHRMAIREMALGIARDRPGDPATLPYVVAVAQSQGLRSYLLEQGVGGVFVGARATEQGICWLPDLAYCVYRTDMTAENRLVTVIVRENVVAISSPWGGNSAFCNPINTPDPVAWLTRWQKTLDTKLCRSLDMQYYAFCPLDADETFVVSKESVERNRYFTVEEVSPTQWQLTTKKSFVETLRAGRRAPPGGLGFGLRIL
jgi:hypothetical protein